MIKTLKKNAFQNTFYLLSIKTSILFHVTMPFRIRSFIRHQNFFQFFLINFSDKLKNQIIN